MLNPEDSLSVTHVPKRPRRGWWPAGVFLLAILLGLSGWAYVAKPPHYTATATFLIARRPTFILFEPKVPSTEWPVYLKTQQALVKSRIVIRNAVRQPKMAALSTIKGQPDPEGWLEAQLRVEFPDNSALMRVSLSGERPAELEAIVNAVVDSYMTHIRGQERQNRVYREEQLKSLWDAYQLKLRDKKRVIREIKARSGESFDFGEEQMEIRILEEVALEVGREAQRVGIEISAPERISLISKARASRGG